MVPNALPHRILKLLGEKPMTRVAIAKRIKGAQPRYVYIVLSRLIAQGFIQLQTVKIYGSSVTGVWTLSPAGVAQLEIFKEQTARRPATELPPGFFLPPTGKENKHHG